MTSFGVYKRNPHHWDVNSENGRDFRIRGEPGKVLVYDERAERGTDTHHFTTVTTAMAWITDIYMRE